MGRVTVKVIPSSTRNQLVGWLNETLKIKVTAPAKKGKANQAVIKLLAKVLNLSHDRITIITGEAQRVKIIEINDFDQVELITKLTQSDIFR
jgi:uncharacterized protein (TIGR00251 family)